MRIIHNMMAMNASQQVKKNSGKTEKQLQGLASGLRINMAADDAAGLAVSEKMRALVTGLGQAERNSMDGISLLHVAEGSLQEVHSMLDRVKELAGQSANGIYQDETDRKALQMELEQTLKEIDRIAKNTNFNNIPLFQDKGPQFETTNGVYRNLNYALGKTIPLQEMLQNTKEDEFNIIYTETTDFVTNQSGVGNQTNTSYDSTGIRNTLETEIVPQVVSQMLSAYPAFSYLNGSSIGIGLKLYSDSTSSTLASVSSSTSGSGYQTYQLSINMATVGNLSNASDRSELEKTISHEMMHAFMFEATTQGTLTGGSDKFPNWLVEGMAQSTCGPGNWMSALNITGSSSISDIQTALSSNSLASNSGAAQYGTGYLACMYLGHLANGGGAINAASISDGISKILGQVISGDSLNMAINSLTNYQSLADFQTKFSADGAQFVKDLLTATGNGSGGVVSGDLTATDLITNGALPGINLFQLDTNNDNVQNIYPSNININSGGGVNSTGNAPVPVAVTYPDGIFSVGGTPVLDGAQNPGYNYDITTGILTITQAGTYKLSGGSFTDPFGKVLSGKIVLADNIAGNVNLELDGVNINRTQDTGVAAMNLGKGNDVSIEIKDGTTNVFKSGANCAGIQMGIGTDLQIKDGGANTGKLEAYGGTSGAGIGAGNYFGAVPIGDIVISSGNITAIGGASGGAGIGASNGSSVGNITINGGTIYAESLEHGAGIGGGWTPTRNGDITITGGTIIAKGVMHGTGIGAGCQGSSGKITITGGTITAEGGNDGAGIGASWNGDCGDISISGGTINASGGTNGAGIGAGLSGSCEKIVITGGQITAEGGNNGAGIGSGVNATGGDIEISGATVTALGGLTNGGGNIGNYTDTNHLNPSNTVIKHPSSVMAGTSGEGLYNTSGSKDAAGDPVYSYPLPLDPNKVPVRSIVSVSDPNGKTLTWPPGTEHIAPNNNSAFMWMNGENQQITVTYNDGSTEVLDLVFYPDAGVWRERGAPAPPAAIPPNNPSNPVNPPNPNPGGNHGAIILQIGPNSDDILEIPVFYFSVKALNADGWSVATQSNAQITYMSVESAKNRVSKMRGTYGAFQNRLEHNINNLSTTKLNTTEAESRIRDADMAKMMMEYTKNQVQGQASQAMLAQANQLPQGMLQLLQ